MSSLTLTVAPSEEPVTTAEAKSHSRVTTTADDTLIATLIKAARRYAEVVTKRQLVTATWELRLDAFPTEIVVPFPPLQSVSRIDYIDTDGASQTLSTSIYEVDVKQSPGRIQPAFEQSWPDTRAVYNAVTVTFVAGYGLAAAVPEDIKQAILMLVAHYYEVREGAAFSQMRMVPYAVDALLWSYRVGIV